MTPGETETSQIAVSSIGGFAGPVYLSAKSSYPLLVSLTTDVLPVSSGGTGATVLSVTVQTTTTPGRYSASIEATGGCAVFNSTSLDVTVIGPDFTVSTDKPQLTISPGHSDTSATITLASQNGFAGTVALSTSTPLIASLSHSSVLLKSHGTGTSALNVTVANGTVPGNYTVHVDGNYGFSTVHSVDIIVSVPGSTFVLSALRGVLTLVVGGPTNSSTITATPVNGFTGTVSLSNSTFPIGKGLEVTLGATRLTILGSASTTLTEKALVGTTPGEYFVTVTGTAAPLTSSTVVVVHVKSADFYVTIDSPFVALVEGVSSCTSTITAIGLDGFVGPVGLAVKSSPPGLTIHLSAQSVTVPFSPISTLTISAASSVIPGLYDVLINGTGISPAQLRTADISVLVIGSDFSLASSPRALTIIAGQKAASVITVNALDLFSAVVTLGASSDDPNLTPILSSTSVPESGTSTLTVQVASNTLSESASINITGTSGRLAHTIFVSVTVLGPGFSLSANPSTISAGERVSKTSTISVTALNGFTGAVDLTAIPSGNLNATIRPGRVTSSGAAILNVNSTIPGAYTVDISGNSIVTGTAIFNDTLVTVTIFGPDYNLSATSPLLTILPGSYATSVIAVNELTGFNSPVDLTATGDAGIDPTLSSARIIPGQTSTLTVQVARTTNPGSYSVDVTGASGSLTHSVVVAVKVSGFTLSANPTTLTVDNGTSQISVITVTAVNGFTGMVTLAASSPPGLTAAFDHPTFSGHGTSQLSLYVYNALAGTYLVNVTGISGQLSQTATITVTISRPDFTLDPSTPVTVICAPSVSCVQAITVMAQNGFAGTVSLTASPSAGLSCGQFSPITAYGTEYLSCGSNIAGQYTVTVKAASGTLSHTTATITCLVSSAPDFKISTSATNIGPLNAGATNNTVTITITPLNGFASPVSLTASTSPGLTASLNPTVVSGPSGAQLTVSAAIAGNYTLTVIGAYGSLLSHSTPAITVVVVDFGISASSPAPTDVSSSATTTVTVLAMNGFKEVLSLGDAPPAGLVCQRVNPFNLPSAGIATVSCTATSAGTYFLTVTGTTASGSLTHSTTATFSFQDFGIAVSSPSTAGTGLYSNSTITIFAKNGFTGTVYLTPSPSSGLNCNGLSRTTITAYGTTTMSCTASSAGSYTLSINATSGSLSHSASASLTYAAPDFAVSVSVTSLSFNNGTSATTTIMISPQYGFTGRVTLDASTSTAGLSCSFNPTSIPYSSSSTLTCSGNAPGDYIVHIRAASGSIVRTSELNVHVASVNPVSPVPPYTILGLSPIVFYSIIVTAIVVIGGSTVVWARRARHSARQVRLRLLQDSL